MAIMPVARPNISGIDTSANPPSAAWSPASAGGDVFDNDGMTYCSVVNLTGSAITVTFDAPGSATPDQANSWDPDVVKSVPALQTKTFGPFANKQRFNDANGRVKVTCSSQTNINLLPYRVY